LRQRGFPNIVMARGDADLARKLTLDPAGSDGIDLWMTGSTGAKIVAKNVGVGAIREVFADLLSQDYWLACSLQMPAETVLALQEAVGAMQKDGTLRSLSDPTRFLAQ